MILLNPVSLDLHCFVYYVFRMIKKKLARNRLNLFPALFLLALSALQLQLTQANAASSDWQDIGGGKARLVANLDPSTNVISGVVEVKLNKGWSTYWRYPGSYGIPPIFNFSNSSAVTVGEVSFPTPRLIEQEYGAYAGYKEKVLFPFDAELLSTNDGKINLDLLIGVCEKICIPAKAEMTIKVSDLFQSDPIAVQTISFAKLGIPKIVAADDIIVGMEKGNSGVLVIKAKYEERFGTPSLFVEGPTQWYLTPAKLVEQNAGIATFEVDISNAPSDLEVISSELKFTLAAGARGIEIKR